MWVSGFGFGFVIFLFDRFGFASFECLGVVGLLMAVYGLFCE